MGGHVESGSAILDLDMDDNKSFTPPDFGVTILGCVINTFYTIIFSLMDLILKVLLLVIFFG